MKNSLSMCLPLLLSSFVGEMQLEQPIVDYYYSRSNGKIIKAEELKVNDQVLKGQDLIVYLPEGSKDTKSITVISSGQIKFVDNTVSIGEPLIKGQLLFKVTSNLVHGKIGIADEAALVRAQALKQLYVCHDKFAVRLLLSQHNRDQLLFSSELSSSQYSFLLKQSQKGSLQFFSTECK